MALGGGFPAITYYIHASLQNNHLVVSIPETAFPLNGKSCRGIAEWDGKNWSCTEMQGKLCKATFFWRDSLLAIADSGIFKRVGNAWEAFGRKYAFAGQQNRLAAAGGKLWMYGDFEMIGDSSFRNIAVWDGGDWKKPFPIHPARVTDFIEYQGALYLIARGDLDPRDTVDPVGIYRANGATLERLPVRYPYATLDKFATDGKSLLVLGGRKKWEDPVFNFYELRGRREGLQVGALEAEGFGLSTEYSFNGDVFDACFAQNKLVIAGRFSGVGGARADNIALLEGGTWKPISTIAEPGPSYAATVMRSWGQSLVVGGVFLDYAGSGYVGGIAKWDGAHWSDFREGFTIIGYPGEDRFFPTPKITAITGDGAALYVGGEFDGAKSGRILNIARWDGSDWKGLGDGYYGNVTDILVDGKDVYVAGQAPFPDTPPSAANMGKAPLSKWDGSTWTNMKGIGDVARLAKFRGEVYAAGLANGLTVWRNNAWWSAGNIFTHATDLVTIGSQLFVVEDKLIRLDSAGRTDTLATGTGRAKLATDGQDLFVLAAGTQAEFPGIGKSDLARWNGTEWKSLGLDLFHDEGQLVPTSITVHQGYVYLSGWLRGNGLENVWFYARWNKAGGTWSKPRYVELPRKARPTLQFDGHGSPYLSLGGASGFRFDARGVRTH